MGKMGYCQVFSRNNRRRLATTIITVTLLSHLLAKLQVVRPLNYNPIDPDNKTSTIGFKSIPPTFGHGDKKSLSEDCIAQRNEILRRHHIAPPAPPPPPPPQPQPIPPKRTLSAPGYQSLRPRNENSTPRPQAPAAAAAIVGAASGEPALDILDGLNNNSVENEHIPQCTPNGKYVPTQCHKMGYCWCVNKYGQAIRNSAVEARESPNCDLNVYQNGGVDSMVVTDIRPNRLKVLLKLPNLQRTDSMMNNNDNTGSSELDGQPQSGDGPDGGGGGSGSELSSSSSANRDDDFKKRVSASQEPSLYLAANQCELSKSKAWERAARHPDDNIWIPECDSDNAKLYAEKQCKSKICWCVNRNTGLPLLTSEQLTQHVNLNCTEMKRAVEMAQVNVKHDKQKPQYYQGFSQHCDANKRADFVRYMVNQFRQQISEYNSLHPTSPRPEGITSANPHGLPDQQVMVWKFNLLDVDHNKKLEDREWSKFKIDFKFVDRLDDFLKPMKLNPGAWWSPLGILRFQRHCWRDFLEFCDKGNLLVRDFINLNRWLTCLEQPSKVHPLPPANNDKTRGLDMERNLENAHANTREAAINRSKERNPFTSILRAD